MKTVLTLDGGSGRGRYSFGMCNLIADNSDKPLSSIFDLIVSVSVGSWIGALIAFGKLNSHEQRMEIEKDLNLNSAQTFITKNKHGPWAKPKYDGIGKRNVIKRYFDEKIKLGDAIVPFVILCSSLGGKDRVFKSWDEKDAEISLVELLDATSAIPSYFPPVKIHHLNEILMDGGVISNRPLELAFIVARRLFGRTTEFKILSIGTQVICELQTKVEDISKLGLINWAKLGLFDIIAGVGNTISIQLMDELLGEERFLRIACECAFVKTDIMDESSNKIIQTSIDKTWKNQKTNILQFLAK